MASVVLTVFAQTITPPGPGVDPIGWIAALALSACVALFWLLMKAKDALLGQVQTRCERCERREDALLEAQRSANATVADAASTTKEVFGLAKVTVERLAQIDARSERIERGFDEFMKRATPRSR